MLFCLDKAEVYGDEGFCVCLTEEDKENFIVHIGAGNPLPPMIK
mgnify:CR=1 FL=1